MNLQLYTSCAASFTENELDEVAFKLNRGQISVLYGRGQIIQSKGVAVFIKRLPEMVRELPVDISYTCLPEICRLIEKEGKGETNSFTLE